MARSDLQPLLEPIDRLHDEIVQFVPQTTALLQFRSDLTGLLVVAMAAAYENCVKEVLIGYCDSHSPIFGVFATNQYDRLNSRINLNDLVKYAALFGDQTLQNYKDKLGTRRKSILDRTGRDICGSYEQLLKWRHQYAHAGQQNTTIEEAYASH